MDAARPSIWTSPIIQLLLRLPDLQLHHVAQYRWGAEAVKPTGLLTYVDLGPSVFRVTYTRRLLATRCDAVKPKGTAIGKDANGEFKTSPHEEYPGQFCLALAFGLRRRPCKIWMMGLYVLLSPVQLSVPAHSGHQTFRIFNSFCKPLQQGFDPLTHEMKKWCVSYFKKRGSQQSMNLSIYPSIHPSLYLSFDLCLYLSISPFIYLCFFPSIHPSIQSNPIQSIHPSIHPSIHLSPSIYLSIYRSICLSIDLSIYLSNQT